jgi:hypothetical protein
MKSNSARSTRARNSFAKAVKGAVPLKKDASYVGELSSGHEAITPGIDGPQAGKAHQEATNEGGKTDGGAHHDDKRDSVGRAAKSDGQSLRQAARDLRVVAATLSRAASRLGSYIGELSSGYDATTPGIDDDQNKHGKAHQEAVNKGGKGDGGAHHDDKRDSVGRAARSKGMEKLGEALLALEKEAKGGKLSDSQQSTLADTFKQLGREFDKVLDRAGALEGDYKSDAEILVSAASDEWVSVEATGHPLEDGERVHKSYEGRKVDEPAMKSEQWFEIGPGEFKDPRDAVEKATAKSEADHYS